MKPSDEKRENQRIDPLWKELWPPIRRKLEHRMAVGHREYGDRSFSRPVFALLNEVEEELMDQMVWSFIAITRLGRLRDQVRELEERLDEKEMDEWIRKAR